MPIERWRGSSSSRGYDGAWRKLRAWHLSRHPLCVYCQQLGRVTPATVVDHIKPITGKNDPTRLDPTALQSLCAPCHDGAKQQLDLTGRLRGAGIDGVPLDPGHHWRRG